MRHLHVRATTLDVSIRIRISICISVEASVLVVTVMLWRTGLVRLLSFLIGVLPLRRLLIRVVLLRTTNIRCGIKAGLLLVLECVKAILLGDDIA